MGKPGLMEINIPAKNRESKLDTIAYSTAIIELAKVDAYVAITMAKLYASEAAMEITREAIQIHGGYGYVRENDVERFFRDAKILEIVDGTSEIQRLTISREIIKDKMA
jgi:alkylation response protein AidB-like acyl-CoA dehydrogenase